MVEFPDIPKFCQISRLLPVRLVASWCDDVSTSVVSGGVVVVPGGEICGE